MQAGRQACLVPVLTGGAIADHLSDAFAPVRVGVSHHAYDCPPAMDRSVELVL